MNESMAWSDYSTVLLIAESGSLSAAARASRESHPTLMRRLNAIEGRLGVRLFERFRQGYQATEAGEEVLATARRMRVLSRETERKLSGRDQRPFGVVVLTTTDTIFAGLVAPVLPAFRAAYPDIELDIRLSNAVHDLARRDADIALRPALEPAGYLKGRKLGVIRQALYSSAEFLGVAREEIPIIGPSGAMPYDALDVYMREEGLNRRCAMRLDSLMAMHGAVASGAGAAVLPTYLCETPDFTRHGDNIESLETPLWLLVHPDLQRTARVRATLDFLADQSGIGKRLEGGKT